MGINTLSFIRKTQRLAAGEPLCFIIDSIIYLLTLDPSFDV